MVASRINENFSSLQGEYRMNGKKETKGKDQGEFFNTSSPLSKMKWYAWSVAAGWTALLIGLLAWDVEHLHQDAENFAIKEARANFSKDQAFRYWASSHGGVYVPVDENTPPNPYLKHIPERDITTPSGKELTLMNPAYMVRQMNEFFSKEYGIAGHITSLKLHNPDNVPDEWEVKALKSFEMGEKEVMEFSAIEGEPYIRLMQPLILKEGCLKCHAYQDYKLGDVRGGVSVSVPLSGLYAEERAKAINAVLSHSIIWLLGMVGIWVGYGRIRRYFLDRLLAEEKERESRERAYIIVESALDGVVEIDASDVITAWNPQAETIFGWSHEEIIGKKISETIIPAQYREAHLKGVKHFLATGEGPILNKRIELRALHRDGHEIQVELTASPLESGSTFTFSAFVRDMTERKIAEEKLREADERVNALLNATLESLILIDLEGNILAVNTTGASRFKETSDDLIGKNIFSFMSPELVESRRKLMSDVISTRKNVTLEDRREGRTFFTNLVPVQNGMVNAIAVFAQDITDRKLAEDALQERMRLAEFSSDVGATLAKGGVLRETLQKCVKKTVEHLDAAFSRIWTFNDEEEVLELQASAGIYTHIDGDHSRIPLGHLKIGIIAKDQKPHLTNKVVGDPAVNDQEWAKREGMQSFAGYPLIVEERLVGVLGMFSRKTMTGATIKALASVADEIAVWIESERTHEALTDSEAKLREAQQLTHMGHWDLDLVSNKLNWSDEIYRIFEMDKEKFGASYEAFIEAIHPDDRELVNKAYTQSLESREPYDIDHRLLMVDETVKYVNEKCRTEYDGNGKPLRSIGTVQDITEVKEAEMKLERAKEEAEAASRAKTDFLSRMSHELRTPLNSILGFAQIMQSEEGKLDDKQGLCVEEIVSAGWHLTDLVNEVLDISKVESGNLSLNLEPVDICPIMEECISLIAPLADEKNIEVRCNLKVCNKETVLGDNTRLKEVFLNLLSNAVKYNVDSGMVTISCDKLDGERLLISVADSGKGISEEDRKLLFIPFSRIKGDDSAIQGTGIGLAISKHLVELMGGSIGVESSPGKGSTFWVKLKIDADTS